jgi:hypothetical protein
MAAHPLSLHHNLLNLNATRQCHNSSVNGADYNHPMRRHGHQSSSNSHGDCRTCKHWGLCYANWRPTKHNYNDKSDNFGECKCLFDQ